MTSRAELQRLRDAVRAERAAMRASRPVRPQGIPNVIDFVTGERFLNRPNLYPNQGTILKVIFLQDELFTQYDYDVIGEWTTDFKATGNHGIVPDVLDRIRINKAEGRFWFREVDAVIGRRGGKGFLAALSGAYVLYHYLHTARALRDDEDEFYGFFCKIFF